MANNPPRNVEIKGQDHMLAYITPEEGGILQLLGGSGAPGPMGIPSFYGPGGPGDDGTDPGDTSADDGVSEDDNDNTSYSDNTSSSDNNDYSYSPTTISDAMAASSPTGMTGTGGIGGYGPSSVAGSTNIGLDDSIAGMAGVMGGLTEGLDGYSNVQGSVNYAPVQNVPYDIFGLMKGAMNRHARDSLSKGYSPEFSIDPNTGNITSVTGRGGPGMSIPGIGSLMSMLGANMGAVTTTGYAGKGVDDTDIGGNENDDQDIVKDARTFLGEDIAEIEDDKVVGESFIDPELYKYLRGRRAAPSVVVGGYGQDIVGASSAKPIDFSAIDRGLQKTQSGIQAINRYR